MPRRTTTSYAILGLLALQSGTTYALTKQVQRSLKWFWPRAERKLYDEPKNLVVDGFVTARSEPTGKRPRTQTQVDAWHSTADSGTWDGQAVLDGIVERAADVAGSPT